MKKVLALALAVSSLWVGLAATALHASSAPAHPQNVVFILTDDERFDTLQWMPNVKNLIQDEGVTFTEAFDNNPLCCPARTTALTGLTSGDNGVWGNEPDHNGGFSGFRFNGDDHRQVFGWLHDAGYQTALAGKFLNGYNPSVNGYVLPGVDDWYAMLLDHLAGTGCQRGGYFGTCFSDNGTRVHGAGYTTSDTADRITSFIENANPGQPLMAWWTPRAPHQPTTPDTKYLNACPGVRQPIPPSYNKVIKNGPAYMTGLINMSPKKQASLADLWVRSCQTLQSVNDGVGEIVQALQDTGRLGDTLLVFASDNGYLFGEHRYMGKNVPYDESIRVPVVIRDDAVIPDSLKGTTSAVPITDLDYAPTFLDAAMQSKSGLDGKSLFPLIDGSGSWQNRGPLLIENPGGGDESLDGDTVVSKVLPPSYCGVRDQGFMYARYSTGEEELYDLSDPYELKNVAANPAYAGTLATLRQETRQLCAPLPPGYTWP